MKTLIGIVTFGNLPFTQLCINEIRATTKSPVDFFVIVGKPGDEETAQWLRQQAVDHRDLQFHPHHKNYGFPASLNDIIDYLRDPLEPGETYDHLILVGNDVVVYPGAVDALIETARDTDYEWICGSQFDVQSLCARYPEARPFFHGPNYEFKFVAPEVTRGTLTGNPPPHVGGYIPSGRPWELHQEFHTGLEPAAMKDVQNLCLYKRSVFEKIGYFDVNFWPNGYFSDNDYARRGNLAGVQACGVQQAAYFHFWSRTIHQGDARPNGKYFAANAEYYQRKWGGPVGAEVRDQKSEVGIFTRAGEAAVLAQFQT